MRRFSRRKLLLQAVAGAVAFGALGRWKAGASGAGQPAVEPPEIAYGTARCAMCNMIVKDPEHAASLVTTEGSHAFCEIGCLLAYLKMHHPNGENVVAALVRDWASHAWTEARTATFVRTDEVHTPMRFGLVAFAERPEAEAFASQHSGEVLDFKQATHYVMTERARRKGSSGGGHGG